MLGKDHIMGVAIGNELDVAGNNQACWGQGLFPTGNDHFWNMFKSRVDDLDSMGFNETKVTVVWSMGLIGGDPFNGAIMDFLTKAHDNYGDRWVWSVNPYPIWDHSQQPQNPQECDFKIDNAIALSYTKTGMSTVRTKVNTYAGESALVWATESGWSAPGIQQAAQEAIVQRCPRWAAQETLWTFYQNLMDWDMTLNDGLRDLDHMFYFTLRDVHGESFGMIQNCDATQCKLQGPVPSGLSGIVV